MDIYPFERWLVAEFQLDAEVAIGDAAGCERRSAARRGLARRHRAYRRVEARGHAIGERELGRALGDDRGDHATGQTFFLRTPK